MEKKEIIAALQAGSYEVRHEQDCGCTFDWRVAGRVLAADIIEEELIDGCETDCCWEGYVLYVAGEAVAEHVRYEARRVLAAGITGDDIPDDIWDKMRMSDIVVQGESPNCDAHETTRREALINWLMVGEYDISRDDVRGFSNEYSIVLRTREKPKKNISRQASIMWANDILYSGDAATKAYNNVHIE